MIYIIFLNYQISFNILDFVRVVPPPPGPVDGSRWWWPSGGRTRHPSGPSPPPPPSPTPTAVAGSGLLTVAPPSLLPLPPTWPTAGCIQCKKMVLIFILVRYVAVHWLRYGHRSPRPLLAHRPHRITPRDLCPGRTHDRSQDRSQNMELFIFYTFSYFSEIVLFFDVLWNNSCF